MTGNDITGIPGQIGCLTALNCIQTWYWVYLIKSAGVAQFIKTGKSPSHFKGFVAKGLSTGPIKMESHDGRFR